MRRFGEAVAILRADCLGSRSDGASVKVGDMIDFATSTYRVEPMRLADIPEVMEIEQLSFTAPWSASAYERELVYNESASFFVARPHPVLEGQRRMLTRNWLRKLSRSEALSSQEQGNGVIGYGGFWLMAGEAHIMTIAVKPALRGRHVGELLLATMIERAGELGASQVTLEVRVTNNRAQSLYRKYGFMEVGKRLRYYSDNNEDALIMTTAPIRSASYQQQFQGLKLALEQQLVRRG